MKTVINVESSLGLDLVQRSESGAVFINFSTLNCELVVTQYGGPEPSEIITSSDHSSNNYQTQSKDSRILDQIELDFLSFYYSILGCRT